MGDLVAIARTEIRARLGLRAAFVIGTLAALTALYETLTPVLINGDPLSRGWWGAAYGASTGVAAGLLCALACVVVLTGHDLDTGYFAERAILGTSGAKLATGQLLAAWVVGLGTWAASCGLTALLSAGDLGVSWLTGRTVGTSPPEHVVTVTAMAAPLVIMLATAALWALVVAAGSGRWAVMWLALAGSTFLLCTFTVGRERPELLALHPFAGFWRAVSALPQGRHLPAAVTGSVWPYVLSMAAWTILLALTAKRRWRKLAVS